MEEFDSPGVLQLKLLIGLAGTLACALAIIHMLFKIELNHDSILHNKKKGKLSPEIEANLSELTLNTTEDSGDYDGTFAAIPDANLKQTVDAMDDANNNASIVTLQKSVSRDGSIGGSEYAKSVGSGSGSPKNKKIDPLAPSMDIYRRKRLHQETKVGVIFNVSLLTLTSYLLLVFLPSGILLSLIAMTLLSGIILRTQVVEDLRRSRLDRISAIFTLILFMATFLNMATYAGIGKKEGGVYEGPARIVGYDVDNYDNEGSNSNTLRTDLEVEWGGGWGCPYNPTKSCRTSVQGALCAVSEDRKRRMNRIQSLRWLEEEEPDVNADDDEAVDNGGYYGYDMEVVEEVIEEEMSGESAEIEYEEEEEAVEQIIDQYYNEDTTKVDEAIDIAYEEEDEVFDIVDMEEEDVEDTFEDIEIISEEENKMDTTNVTAQIEELKEEIVQLEMDAEVLAEDNYDLEYVAESTEETAAYYQVVDAIDEAELDAAIDVIENLDETNNYYVAVVQEDEAENEVLEEENEFLEEETDNLKDTVNDVVEYYQGKEKHEDMKKHDKGKGGSSSAGAGAKNNGTKVEVEDVVVYYKTETANGTVEEGYYVVMEEETEEGEVLYGYGSEITTGEELEDIAESIYSSVQDAFSFEDDTYEDEYWNYEWGNVWGEYACNDLFDADLENIEYNADEAPGSDDWPYVNIYGSCNSCKAFIVDYYSEEHFDNIRRYQRHAGKYAIFGTLSLLITLALGFMQRLSPSEENEINLLMDQGGLMV
mmetsp:Transcript_5815/g.8180  ORF Transcript_5815/g.8180 Transcript_5815/m.8180 type:complete len:762 (+) Transcript_5815:112-2397(+)